MKSTWATHLKPFFGSSQDLSIYVTYFIQASAHMFPSQMRSSNSTSTLFPLRTQLYFSS